MPLSPSTMMSRASAAVGATNATLLAAPADTRLKTNSAPVRVLPQPRPARISQIAQAPGGGSWLGLAVATHPVSISVSSTAAKSSCGGIDLRLRCVRRRQCVLGSQEGCDSLTGFGKRRQCPGDAGDHWSDGRQVDHCDIGNVLWIVAPLAAHLQDVLCDLRNLAR